MPNILRENTAAPKVLIVDDELPVLCGLSKALPELCDFEGDIRTVVNGREAIDEVSHCFYNICFLDIRLPDISGLEVLKDIKDISPDTAIIIMSANPMSDELDRLIENKEVYFIDKPFDFEQITHLTKQMLDSTCNFCEDAKYKKPKRKEDMRRHEREPLAKTISFHVMEKNITELGGVLNISYEGLCIETYYPLTKGQTLLFKGIAHKTGIVVWSKVKENDNYKAGIKFAS